MKHLIMGTAGHVDHGKTALIRALTGIECDTHAQEKQRGITINLGFAHLPLPGGDILGIVDVPGHRDFVRTMVGGASGIDLVLLVVAADCGVMPQTREHLQIMDLLGIRGGLVALSRIDLAEADLVEMAEEDVRDFLQGSFLEGCPIVPVSAVTGEGLEPLKKAIAEEASRHENRSPEGIFRLFVDRIFTVAGFGTVVAGSVTGGSLHVDGSAYLLPGAKKSLRVRRLERYGEETQQVVAGDRAAMNLTGLSRDDFTQGKVISDRPLRDTTMLDATLQLFPHSRRFGIWTGVEFHLGTYEHQVRVHLLDRDELAGGETALAQIHLEIPCVVRHGDRFILRDASNNVTLGGGQVIDPDPLHHRRRPAKLIESLTRLAGGELPQLIAAEVKKHPHALDHERIARILNVSADEVLRALPECPREDVACYPSGQRSYAIGRATDGRLKQRAVQIVADYHRRNPLLEKGRTTEELAGLLGLGGDLAVLTTRLVLGALEADDKLKQVGHTWACADHQVRPGEELARRIELILNHIQQLGMKVSRATDLAEQSARLGIDPDTLEKILRYLIDRRDVYAAEGVYLHGSLVSSCREKLLRALARRDRGMTVAEFRDLVGGNRKACLAMFALFDGQGVTKRVGDLRKLTEAGRKEVTES